MNALLTSLANLKTLVTNKPYGPYGNSAHETCTCNVCKSWRRNMR